MISFDFTSFRRVLANMLAIAANKAENIAINVNLIFGINVMSIIKLGVDFLIYKNILVIIYQIR